MTRPRRLGAAIGLLVLLLFAGRWTAGVLADRWWATELSPAAAGFLTQVHLLRAALKVAGILVAGGWFIAHFLIICRAVGSVQIRRHVANIEIREVLTSKTLLTIAIFGGSLLGFLVGNPVSNWWRHVALAWHGVTYGIVEPFLERDIGLYLAQFPLWQSAQEFLLFLVVLTLGLVFGLYILVGAIRWMEGRPAINDHARRHLGWLFLALGVVLAWGYILEPYEFVAGLGELPGAGGWRVMVSFAPVLAGIALAAGSLSGVWAIQPRHTLAVAAWIVLGVASLVGHWLLPSIFDDAQSAANDARSVERLTRIAYGLEAVRIERVRGDDKGRVQPAVPALWSSSIVSYMIGGDSLTPFWADRARVAVSGASQPAWLVLRPALDEEDQLVVLAIADGRVSPGGYPVFYRPTDTLTSASPIPLLELSNKILRPDAVGHRFRDTDVGPGVRVDTWPKRIALSWALQSGRLLRGIPKATRVDWHLSPAKRLTRLAPFVEWGTPVMRIAEGELVWIVDGYIASSTFPLAHRARWRGKTVGSVRASFIGVVDAESGETHAYLRPGADSVAVVWAAIAAGLILPDSAIPPAVLQALPYPAELFRLQAQEFERSPWQAGTLLGRPAPGSPPSEQPRTEMHWDASNKPIQVATYDQPGGRTVAALLTGEWSEGQDRLRLLRLDSTAAIPSRSVLENRWSRFPSYNLLNDSVHEDGGRLERGPVEYEAVPGGVAAYQATFARQSPDQTVLAWMSVAASQDRLGAGRTPEQAWSNLLGTAAPEPIGAGERERLNRARDWFHRADSAVRTGNWPDFGAAWLELERALGPATDTAKAKKLD